MNVSACGTVRGVPSTWGYSLCLAKDLAVASSKAYLQTLHNWRATSSAVTQETQQTIRKAKDDYVVQQKRNPTAGKCPLSTEFQNPKDISEPPGTRYRRLRGKDDNQ